MSVRPKEAQGLITAQVMLCSHTQWALEAVYISKHSCLIFDNTFSLSYIHNPRLGSSIQALALPPLLLELNPWGSILPNYFN